MNRIKFELEKQEYITLKRDDLEVTFPSEMKTTEGNATKIR